MQIVYCIARKKGGEVGNCCQLKVKLPILRDSLIASMPVNPEKGFPFPSLKNLSTSLSRLQKLRNCKISSGGIRAKTPAKTNHHLLPASSANLSPRTLQVSFLNIVELIRQIYERESTKMRRKTDIEHVYRRTSIHNSLN